MKYQPRLAFAVLACLATASAIWAATQLPMGGSGVLERDAQRLQRARSVHLAEIENAFDAYTTRVDRANTTLARIYGQLIEQYNRRGETATAEQLQAELDDLVAQSISLPFPDELLDEEEAPAVAPGHSQLISAIGPYLINSNNDRAPTERLADYDYIVLYFTAGWCRYCPPFTRELIDFYNQYRSSGKWEVIVVSGDRSERDFFNYMQSSNMPWAAVPFNRIDASNLPKAHPGGFPRVVVLDREGKKAVSARNRHAVLDEFRDLLHK